MTFAESFRKLSYMLSPNRLRVLAAAAEAGSLAAAARKLNYTPSAASQQIASLEREIGTTLLERHGRGVRLTAAGELAVERARDVLELLERTEADVRDLAGKTTGRLRLGWFSTAGTTLLPRAVASYRAQFPDVRLTLAEDSPERCLELVAAGDLDLAIVHDFQLAPLRIDKTLLHDDLLTDEALIGLPLDHRLAHRRRIRLPELADERWIQGVYRGGTAAVLPLACRRAGFEPDIVCQTDEHAALQGLIAAGVGVGLIPRMTLPSLRPDVAARKLTEPRIVRVVRAVSRPSRRSSPAVAAMIETLARTAERLTTECARILNNGPPTADEERNT